MVLCLMSRKDLLPLDFQRFTRNSIQRGYSDYILKLLLNWTCAPHKPICSCATVWLRVCLHPRALWIHELCDKRPWPAVPTLPVGVVIGYGTHSSQIVGAKMSRLLICAESPAHPKVDAGRLPWSVPINTKLLPYPVLTHTHRAASLTSFEVLPSVQGVGRV